MRFSWVYMLASRRNGTLYVGATTDLVRRVAEHREGVGRCWCDPPAGLYVGEGRGTAGPMHPDVTLHDSELQALCRRFGVRRLELFGSAARGENEPRDLDFLVEFEPLPAGERASAYFGLLAELEELFGRPVDLVMTKAIRNRRFLSAIEGERTPLYAA